MQFSLKVNINKNIELLINTHLIRTTYQRLLIRPLNHFKSSSITIIKHIYSIFNQITHKNIQKSLANTIKVGNTIIC